MAEIQEYQPEVGAQGAVGGVTPNLEAVSLFGRGVQHVGASLEEAGDVVHRRQGQEEVSRVYGQIAQARAEWNVQLKQQLRDGTLDPDKFDQAYADYINKMGEGLKTAEGKDFFNRQANRLGGSLMQNAMIGKARIAGEQEYADLQKGVNLHIANIHSNPTPEEFNDAISSTEEMIQAKQKAGSNLTQEQVLRVRKDSRAQFAEALVRGLADKDPGQDADGNDNPNLGKQFLDHGGAAEDLNEAQRERLETYIKQADRNRDVENERKLATAHRLLEKQGYDFMDQNANRVLNGQMSAKEIQMAPLTFQQKEYMMAKMKAQAMDESKTDPRRYTSVYRQIIHGDITTRDQLMKEFDKGGLAPATMDRLTREIDATPEGHVVKNLQRQLDKEAQDLRFKGVGGAYTTAGDAAYTNFQAELYQARESAKAQGITDRQFYSNTNLKDPASPYAILQKYRLNAVDRARIGAQEALGQSPDGSTIRYSNSPTGEVPPPQPPKQNVIPEEDRIKPGENLMQWKKRMDEKRAK